MKHADKVRVVNSVTGGAATVPLWLADHPVFGRALVKVKEGTKPYTPELYKSQTPEEYTASHPEKLPEFNDESDLEIEEEN